MPNSSSTTGLPIDTPRLVTPAISARVCAYVYWAQLAFGYGWFVKKSIVGTSCTRYGWLPLPSSLRAHWNDCPCPVGTRPCASPPELTMCSGSSDFTYALADATQSRTVTPVASQSCFPGVGSSAQSERGSFMTSQLKIVGSVRYGTPFTVLTRSTRWATYARYRSCAAGDV